MSTKPKVFIREATGLVRSRTWFDGMMFNLAYYNIAVAAFIVFGWGSWLFPGADMGISVGVVGLIIAIPLIVGYSFMVMGMPRAGGDYVYVSRGISPPLGAGVALVFMIFQAIFSVGQNAWFAVTTALSPGLAILGYVMNDPGITSLSTTIVQPIPSIAIGLVLLALAFILTLVPTTTLHKVLQVLSPIALLGYPVLYIVMLATSSNAAFQAAFNTYGAAYGTSYQGIIQSATNAGATIAPFSIGASIAALPIVYATLAFPQSSVYTAGETKHPGKQVPISLAVGVIVICVSTYLMARVTYGIFGFDFIQATAFYGFSGAAGYPLPAPPFTNLFFGVLFPNAALQVFMLLSALAWEVLLMVSFAFVASRIIFSLAFDRVIPVALSDVSERFHTPVKANVIMIVGSVFFLVATAYSFLGVYVNSIVAWTSVFTIVMITSILFPFIKKDLFESFPAQAKRKIGGVPAMSIAGLLGTLALLVVFYELFASPVVGVSQGSLIGTGIVVVTYIVGISIYYAAKAYRKREGINLDYVFRQIPPE
jgi:amino acid transporter